MLKQPQFFSAALCIHPTFQLFLYLEHHHSERDWYGSELLGKTAVHQTVNQMVLSLFRTPLKPQITNNGGDTILRNFLDNVSLSW